MVPGAGNKVTVGAEDGPSSTPSVALQEDVQVNVLDAYRGVF
jgi:hypothetical protein